MCRVALRHDWHQLPRNGTVGSEVGHDASARSCRELLSCPVVDTARQRWRRRWIRSGLRSLQGLIGLGKRARRSSHLQVPSLLHDQLLAAMVPGRRKIAGHVRRVAESKGGKRETPSHVLAALCPFVAFRDARNKKQETRGLNEALRPATRTAARHSKRRPTETAAGGVSETSERARQSWAAARNKKTW